MSADAKAPKATVPSLPALPEIPGIAGLKEKVDPVGFFSATSQVARKAAANPGKVAKATTRFATTAAMMPLATFDRMLNPKSIPPIPVNPKDRRFIDPAWEGNPAYFALRQIYLALGIYVDELLAAGTHEGQDDLADQKASLTMRLAVEALAPTNFLATNPGALVKAFQSGGRSVADGARLALEDLVERGGRPKKVDRDAFVLGKDLATSKGKVVFRNDLIELIQYAPETEQVHEVPILVSPPWINKFYIMDLAPNRSLFEWAIRNKRTLFTLSYRNPDASMRDYTFDNYLEEGPLTGLKVVQEITGADKVDLFGLCLGGAMASMTAAYLKANADDRLNTLTITNTLLDYSKPGELATMVDPETLKALEKKMNKTGFLDGADMAGTFDMLRANDLIFNYVVSRWLQGEPPSTFDILAWNEDSTRMPAAMHTMYLKALYQENRLAKGEMELKGSKLNLGDVTSDVYVVGTINDHIVPWDSSYEATQLFGGNVRYILSSGGHIAGIVNPPTPKAWFEADETGEQPPADPKQWRAKATRHTGSWWEDWTKWYGERAGELVDPPKMGSSKHKPICDAPGTYVFG